MTRTTTRLQDATNSPHRRTHDHTANTQAAKSAEATSKKKANTGTRKSKKTKHAQVVSDSQQTGMDIDDDTRRMQSELNELRQKQAEMEAAQADAQHARADAERARAETELLRASTTGAGADAALHSSQLQEELAQLCAERDEAQRQAAAAQNTNPASGSDGPSTVLDGSIPRPSNLKSVNIENIRTHLGLIGREHNDTWRDLRSDVRDMIRAGFLDFRANFKSQSTKKLADIYNAIEQKHPTLRRFAGQWGTEYILKEVWNNRHSYISMRNRASRSGGDDDDHDPPSSGSRNGSPSSTGSISGGDESGDDA